MSNIIKKLGVTFQLSEYLWFRIFSSQKSRYLASSAKRIIFLPLFISLSINLAGAKSISAQNAREAILCDDAARTAAYESGVPLSVLQALTRTETGRKANGEVEPWPWTVNMEGRGVWVENRNEALLFVYDHFRTGARSFDVGCYQIRYRWHGANVSSIEERFKPLENARYAALFLRSLFNERGNWNDAAGAFHSRTAIHADRYMVRFGEILDNIAAPDQPLHQGVELATASQRINRFALLQNGNSIGLGSLVPLRDASNSTPMIDFTNQPGD